MGADRICNQHDEQHDHDQRNHEDHLGDADAVAVHVGRGGSVDTAEEADYILAHGDIAAHPDAAEDSYEIAADRGMVGRGDVPEEVDHVVMRFSIQADIAEEDDDIAHHVAIGVHTAEEADGIVDRRVGRDTDVAEELDSILFSARRPRAGCECSREQAEPENGSRPEHPPHYTPGIGK